MTPIKITFQSNETITIYSEDPMGFAESVGKVYTPEIRHMEYVDTDCKEPEPELQEVQIVLDSGTCILCYIEPKLVAKADVITGIAECNESIAIAYAKIVQQEAALDERFVSARLVINNIPDLHTRKGLHEKYLKRKAAYVSAVEAIVDGVIRRPDEEN